MRKNILYIGLTLLLSFALTACGSENTGTTSNDTDNTPSYSQGQQQDVDGIDIDLYADFSAGSTEAEELDLIKTKAMTVPTVTAEIIAIELSEWSGLDFTINSGIVSENILTVDWSSDSTLITNLDDREQKEDFHFFDADSMRWFMMDSLYKSCMENMDISEVYYTMDGGKELAFEELYPVSIFPKDVPYMGSPFYFVHADLTGDISEEGSDPGDTQDYAPTAGIWRIDGAPDTAFIDMDGMGSFTTFYANGAVESDGYLTYNREIGEYEMYTNDNILWNVFYLSSEGELVMGRDEGIIYKKD